MSRRTAEANNAIRIAWQQEKERVLVGKGTRDWTPEQQKDIIEKGKAYDTDGRAFEGQHMKSVEKYPEYQGDPNNIQFLTRDEHLAAHDGNWQNPTNWYYDPQTGQKHDFGEGKYEPCRTFDLSEPIGIEKMSPQESTTKESPAEPNAQTTSKAQADCPEKNRGIWARSKAALQKVGEKIKSTGEKTWKAVASGSKAVGSFVIHHPKEIIELLGGIIEVANGVSNLMNKTSSSDSYSNSNSTTYYTPIEEDDTETGTYKYEGSQESDDCSSGTPKCPHDRKGYTGHRWTKDENGERVLKETQIKATRIHPEK